MEHIKNSTNLTTDIKLNATQTKTLAECVTNRKHLPVFFMSNIQSFSNTSKKSKTEEIEATLGLNNIDVACLTETWLTENSKDQIQFENYILFHAVRNKMVRNSGGVTIAVNKEFVSARKLDIDVPEHIESLWISIRPKWLPRSISIIIVAGVYYPGSTSAYAPDQDDIILHLTETVHQLYQGYENPLFIIMGDFNDLNIDELCDACKLKQVVKVPTRKNAILDLILTNNSNDFYESPLTLPSIGTSDHDSVIYKPFVKQTVNMPKKTITIRRFNDSSIREFGSWLVKFNWCEMLKINDVNQKVAYFMNIIWTMIDKFFPLIKVVITNNDKKWITSEIKYLIAERQEAHHKKNYEARNHIAKKVRYEIRKAKVNYKASKAKSILSTSTKEWYQLISNLISNGKKSSLILNNVPELAQKPIEEIVGTINKHFASICQTYPPPNKFTAIHENPGDPNLKLISEFDTYKLLKKFSKKSLGPNDFPKRILEEFSVELALPFSDITNCALKSGIFPDAYKISEIIPIPKENPPRALKDLRPISKTPIGGKILEKMIISELECDTKNTLNDPTQFGNSKGCSTTHYLVKFTNEAFISTDVGNATTAITIDYSKAFDLVDHSTLINKLVELGVRGKLIKLIISFLSDRSHYTKINGIKSDQVYITCGVPQGTISGPRLFTILIKGIKCSKVSNYKFVDDKTLVYSYSGDPTSFLQMVLNLETAETEKDKMVINEAKCNVITFNFSNKNIGPQNLLLNGNILNSVNKIKLLGVIITDDLRWSENTAQICKKVNKKFYLLCILRQFDFNQEELLIAWKVLLRPITEYAVPLWHSGLLKSDINKLERLQKKAIGLILGTTYIENRRYYKVNGQAVSYETALTHLELPTLTERREILTSKFALETFKNERHKGFFKEKVNVRPNSRYKPRIQEEICATERLKNAAVPYMSKILNNVKIGK